MQAIEARWDEIKETIRKEYDLSDVSYHTWIEPLKFFDVQDDVVIILITSNQSHALNYISSKYKDFFRVTITEMMDHYYEVSFILEKDARKDKSSAEDLKSPFSGTFNINYENANLNPKYKFDTFVVGSNNKFAHSACLAVAESPGDAYNPLYIYGGAGLGKTHLMHSIGHFVLEQNPDMKVIYVTSESFTNEVIESIRSGNAAAMTKLRDKYRTVDVLMIDDIQFIIGKESTQEEFFHTFNHLHTSGKQIIISSDKPPKDIETLESRLRTRFEWGLIADISAPNYETRMAILQKKIELDHLEKYKIPNDVLEYIATNVKTNIRELEGSLNKLIFLYKLDKNAPIDIALAAEALKDIISSENNREVTPELILDIVSEHFGISVKDIKSNKRNAEIAVPRQIAMYLIRSMTETSLKAIGVILGGKDHSTIKYGVEKIASEIEEDEVLSNTINIIKKKINPA